MRKTLLMLCFLFLLSLGLMACGDQVRDTSNGAVSNTPAPPNGGGGGGVVNTATVSYLSDVIVPQGAIANISFVVNSTAPGTLSASCVAQSPSGASIPVTVVPGGGGAFTATFITDPAYGVNKLTCTPMVNGVAAGQSFVAYAVGDNSPPMFLALQPQSFRLVVLNDAVASFDYAGTLIIAALGQERWYIQLFLLSPSVTTGRIYAARIKCSGGGVFDYLFRGPGPTYPHRGWRNGMLCDGTTRTVVSTAPVTELADIIFIPRSTGTQVVEASWAEF